MATCMHPCHVPTPRSMPALPMLTTAPHAQSSGRAPGRNQESVQIERACSSCTFSERKEPSESEGQQVEHLHAEHAGVRHTLFAGGVKVPLPYSPCQRTVLSFTTATSLMTISRPLHYRGYLRKSQVDTAVIPTPFVLDCLRQIGLLVSSHRRLMATEIIATYRVTMSVKDQPGSKDRRNPIEFR